MAMPSRRIRYAGGVLDIEEAWFPIGMKDLWHARYRYRDRTEGGSVTRMAAAFLARAWNPSTIRAVFASCGLEIAEMWAGFDREPFSRGASRILVAARRKRAWTGALPRSGLDGRGRAVRKERR